MKKKEAYYEFPLPANVKQILEDVVMPYQANRLMDYNKTLYKEIDRLNEEAENLRVLINLLIEKVKQKS